MSWLLLPRRLVSNVKQVSENFKWWKSMRPLLRYCTDCLLSPAHATTNCVASLIISHWSCCTAQFSLKQNSCEQEKATCLLNKGTQACGRDYNEEVRVSVVYNFTQLCPPLLNNPFLTNIIILQTMLFTLLWTLPLQDPAVNLFCICRLPWRIEGPRPDDLICLFVYMPTKFMMGHGLMNVWETMWGAFGGREYIDATRS
jgi:hypothetical protein